MRTILYLIFFFPVVVSGQLAPDFTVSDIDGQAHSLYSNYLTQGKTVVLKIFYSTCPPCNAQANSLQAIYEEWGSGQYDVEFIEVSNKTWETNQTVSVYTTNHGITFPSVSAAGGSISVVNAYVTGGFGSFIATPTYIVIAPDGSVIWDVEFADLEAALSSTGAVKPETSGVAVQGVKSDLWIAPNPATDFLNVHAKSYPAGQISIGVYNILGSRLHLFKPLMQSSTLMLREDVGGWYPGTYLVRIENNGAVLKTMRFVKR